MTHRSLGFKINRKKEKKKGYVTSLVTKRFLVCSVKTVWAE